MSNFVHVQLGTRKSEPVKFRFSCGTQAACCRMWSAESNRDGFRWCFHTQRGLWSDINWPDSDVSAVTTWVCVLDSWMQDELTFVCAYRWQTPTFLILFANYNAQILTCAPLGNDTLTLLKLHASLKGFKAAEVSSRMIRFLSLLRKRCGFVGRLRTAVFLCRALSAIIKLVDGGEVKEKLFANAGVQLNGIKRCLKVLKWLSCYIFAGMSGLPQEQRGTWEEQTTIKRNSNVSLTSVFLQIWQNSQPRRLHPPQMWSTCLWIQMHSFQQALEALQVLRLGIQLTRPLITCRFLMVTFEEPAILN